MPDAFENPPQQPAPRPAAAAAPAPAVVVVASTSHALTPAGGGPVRMIPALFRALAARRPTAAADPEGAGVVVHATHTTLAVATSIPDSAAEGPGGSFALAALPVASRRSRVFAAPVRRALGARLAEARAAGRPIVVHSHDIWMPTWRVTAAFARRHRLPLLVTPRGTLMPWSLREKRLKKRLAWAAYTGRGLRAATAFHAASEAEVDAIRALGFRQPIALIPGGVDLPPERPTPSTGTATPPARPRTALFLSRLHPGKGLLDLVAAWAAVRPDGWRLRIVGPDHGGHARQVQRAIDAAGLGGVIAIEPAVEDAGKWEALAAADLFVLPTHSENFGLVVAEALAAGVPVVTTQGAPWRGLVEREAGWWVPVGARGVAHGLGAATRLEPGALRQIGASGRAWVRETLAWPAIADRTAALYAWLAGVGPRPADVRVD